MRFIVLVALLLGSCAYQQQQAVAGTLTVNGQPLSAGEVRLIVGRRPSCDKPTSLKSTVKDGHFEFSRPVDIGRLYVIVQEDALCISEGDHWVMPWQRIYGPAPDRLMFACERTANEAWKCKANGTDPL